MSIGPIQVHAGSLSSNGMAHGVGDPFGGLPSGMAAEQRNLIQAIKGVSPAELFGRDAELAFVFDRETRKTLVRVLDRASGEVIRQIPAQQMIEMARQWKSR